MKFYCTLQYNRIKTTGGDILDVPCLVPAYRNQAAAMRKLKPDRIIEINTKISRDPRLHRHLWAVINFTYDNLPEGYSLKSIEQFMDYIKIKVGFVDTYKILGQVYARPRSMAFGNLDDENEFRNNLYNPAIEFCAGILKMPREDLINSSLDYAGPDHRYERK